MLQVGRRQGYIDQPEVLYCLHTEYVARYPAQQLDGIAFFPELDRVRDFHDIALDIKRGRFQCLHPRRHGKKGSPGASRALRGNPPCSLFPAHTSGRFKIEEADKIVLCRFVLQIDKFLVPVNCHSCSCTC